MNQLEKIKHGLIKYKIVFPIILLLISTFTSGCNNIKFIMNVDITNRKIIHENGQFYVVKNNQLEIIKIKDNNGRNYIITSMSQNSSGVTAISVMKWGGYSIIKGKQTSSNKYFLLFVFNNNIKYFPVKCFLSSNSLKWIDNKNLQINLEGKKILYKSPF